MTVIRLDWWRCKLLWAVVGMLIATMVLGTAPAKAATFPELYTVSIAPDPAASNDRADAIRRGMALLLTRVTGRRYVASDPEMAALIQNAQRYQDSIGTLANRDFRIGYRRSAVNDALRELNMPIWGDERPSTLLWIAADFGDGIQAELQASDRNASQNVGAPAGIASKPLPAEAQIVFDAMTRDILTAADERGLPLVLPRLDEADLRQARFTDVFDGFESYVLRVAPRYGADAILIGRITVTTFGPEINWTLLRDERRLTRTAPDPRAGIDWIADEFAAEGTVVGDARLTWITVQGITSWPDYGRVLEYLESRSFIQSIGESSLSPSGELLLRVSARGDDSQIRQLLTLDGILVSPVPRVQNFAPFAPDSRGLVFVPAWRAGAGALQLR